MVAAGELRNPVALLVLVVADNRTLHRTSVRQSLGRAGHRGLSNPAMKPLRNGEAGANDTCRTRASARQEPNIDWNCPVGSAWALGSFSVSTQTLCAQW